jgi:DNA-binding PadR family transcriptional regulator
MPDRPLNATAASLLGFLHQGPMTGWDLVRTAQRVIGDFWSLTQSQVYRELAAMADTGLIKPGERGRRERQPYRLTEAGRTAFAEWINREPGEETIRYPLLLTIAFGRHLPPERLATFVRDHRAVHAERLANYEQLHRAIVDSAGDADPDPYALGTLTFGLAYERAALAWFDGLPPPIRGHGGSADHDNIAQPGPGGARSGLPEAGP